jgi:hypothetical protein
LEFGSSLEFDSWADTTDDDEDDADDTDGDTFT